jgi:hypothetical protein
MTIAPAGLSVAVGLALFWGSNRIVDRILVIPSVEPETSHALLPKLEEIVLAGLGFFFLADGLAELVYYFGKAELYTEFITGHHWRPVLIFLPENFGGLLAGVTRLVAGLALILWSRRAVEWRRRAANPAPLDEES